MSTLSDLIYEKSKDLIDEAYTKGRNAGGYGEGFEAGKQAEYDAFWDGYQDGGNRRNYLYAFSYSGWNNTTFKPKYPIIATGSAAYMFDGCFLGNQAQADYDFVAEGINLDLSGAATITYIFRNCKGIKRVGVLDTTSCNDLNRPFFSSNIETIDTLKVKESTVYDNTFAQALKLKYITIDGVIGNSISFSDCSLLEVSSMDSIYEHLKDYTSASGTYTLTLHASAWARWDAAKPDIVAQYGSMKNYVTATKGWGVS